MTLPQIYSHFIERSIAYSQAQQQPLLTWADPKSPSLCQQGDIIEQHVAWLPVLQQPAATFDNVEHALGITLHQDIKTFYSHYYGAGLKAKHAKGGLEILMVWNSDDLARLQENIIGHILMKRRLKQRETVFFAVTDDDNIMLSVLNSSGEVYLESVGKEVSEKVAENLAEFIAALQPA